MRKRAKKREKLCVKLRGFTAGTGERAREKSESACENRARKSRKFCAEIKGMFMLFGTDGVRGSASYFFENRLAYNLGRALASRNGRRLKIVIARDSRLSGRDIEREVAGGLSEYPTEIVALGIMPTPAVPCVMRRIGADYGVMVSASHNPPDYNGIKIFGKSGEKLTSAEETDIENAVKAFNEKTNGEIGKIGERMLKETREKRDGIDRVNEIIPDGGIEENFEKTPDETRVKSVGGIRQKDGKTGAGSEYINKKTDGDGRVMRLKDAEEIYAENVLRRSGAVLDGLNIRLDCCYGACAACAPKIFAAAGANVRALADEFDGGRINVATGSTNIDYLRARMSADDFIGCAFDGDGDRVLAVAPDGFVIDGDRILYVLTLYLQKLGALTNNTVVGTLMTNYGLEAALNARGITLLRTDVGDKYVIERMKKDRCAIGGETSGHIILAEEGAGGTGDGILTALTLAKAILKSGTKPSEIAGLYSAFPQKTVDIKASPAVKAAVAADVKLSALVSLCGDCLKGEGRALVRPSGTENKIRITVEAKTYETVDETLSLLVPEYEKFAASIDGG